MKTSICVVILFLFAKSVIAQVPNTFIVDPLQMVKQKGAYAKGDAAVVSKVAAVVKTADKLLDLKPQSVMDKNFTPTSGSKHDYMSMGPYWWPDPAKADGLPYIRRDGERNPEIRKITDSEYLSGLESRCRSLAIAWYFTGDEKYAAKAKQLLSAWFLDPDTKMNPNFNFAQAVPGLNDGRGIGLIESRWLAHLADWIGLLENSKSLTKDDVTSIKDWYAKFLTWMRVSKNGMDEHSSKNNHGTFYDFQVVDYALFTGDFTLAKQTLADAKKRIDLQIEADGKQPLELERTNAYGYSTMNLDGWFLMSLLGDRAGVDLSNYTNPKGGNLKKALEWLTPFAFEEKPREYKQIGTYHVQDIYRMLILASKKYDPAFGEKAKAIPATDGTSLTDLLYN